MPSSEQVEHQNVKKNLYDDLCRNVLGVSDYPIDQFQLFYLSCPDMKYEEPFVYLRSVRAQTVYQVATSIVKQHESPVHAYRLINSQDQEIIDYNSRIDVPDGTVINIVLYFAPL